MCKLDDFLGQIRHIVLVWAYIVVITTQLLLKNRNFFVPKPHFPLHFSAKSIFFPT